MPRDAAGDSRRLRTVYDFGFDPADATDSLAGLGTWSSQ
jgi:hypothetical protein